jgi:hypothetical protein
MPDYPASAEMSDAQKLDFLRGLLLDVSSAVQDLRDGVQGLYEKSRQAVPNVGESRWD